MGFIFDKGTAGLLRVMLDKFAPNVSVQQCEQAVTGALEMVEAARVQAPAIAQEVLALRAQQARIENKVDAIMAHLLISEPAKPTPHYLIGNGQPPIGKSADE